MLASAIAVLAMGLTMVVGQQHWSHAVRILAVLGALTATALILDMSGARRDRLLLPITALLVTIGVVLISRIDGYLAAKQMVWVLVGCGALIATYYLVDPPANLANWKYLAGALAVALMVVCLIFAPEKNGARLWLSFGGRFSFQPSEIAKLLMVVFLAGYVAEKSAILRRVGGKSGFSVLQGRYLAPMLVMVALCLALFVGQRDLGTAGLFFGLCLVMLYLATGRGSHAVLGVVVFALGVVVAYHTFPHLVRRMDSWLNPWADATGIGFQPLQGIFALAEGGVGGAGLGLLHVGSRSLPEASSDLIFAVLGQDLGLAGAVGVLMLYGVFVVAGFRIAWQARESFEGLLAAGLTSMFALQAFIIVGGVLRVIPLTGLPLPMISYGGTSMLANFIALGLLLAISRDNLPERPDSG
ncbi:MAG TPA: FtsW/RodA/SpoVE family cell cycle protein [Armatimonadota bacterium]|jgi:cell division protein FtsW (lipid II flippase)